MAAADDADSSPRPLPLPASASVSAVPPITTATTTTSNNDSAGEKRRVSRADDPGSSDRRSDRNNNNNNNSSTSSTSNNDRSPPQTQGPDGGGSKQRRRNPKRAWFSLAFKFHIFSFYSCIKALCMTTWEVSFEPFPADAPAGLGAGSHRTANGSLPVTSIADSALGTVTGLGSLAGVELAIVAVAALCSFAALLVYVMRFLEHLLSSRAWSIVGFCLGFAQVVFIVGALLRFQRVHDHPRVDVGLGYLAATASAALELFSLISILIDGFQSNFSNDHIQEGERKLLMALTFIIALMTAGGILFHYIGDMPFEDSFPFAIVTSLSIGYGNTVLRSTGSRLFLVLYFLLAASGFAFFFVGQQEVILERIEHKTKRKLEARRLRRDLALERINTHFSRTHPGERLELPANLLGDRALVSKNWYAMFVRRVALYFGTVQPTQFEQALMEVRAARAVQKRQERLRRAANTWHGQLWARLMGRRKAAAAATAGAASAAGLRGAARETPGDGDSTSGGGVVVAALAGPNGLEMGEILAARGASGVVDDSRGDADTDAEWTEGETDDEVVLEIRDGGGGGSMGGLSSGFPSSGSLPAGAAGDGGVDRWRRLASSSDNTTLTAGTTVDGSEPSISESEGLLEDELEKLMERQKLRRLVVFLLSSWLAAAGLFQWTEPTWTYVDALYFCFTTISTIGYGDLFPTTAYAWELWFFYVMAAVGIYSLLITVLGEIGMRRYEAAAAFHRQRRHRHRANEQGRAKDTAGQTTSGKAKRRGTAKRRSALALQSASPSPPADTSRFRTAL